MAQSFDDKTDLAKQRTLLACERTLMAWIRTSVSMSGFGFTIYKFFQFLIEGETVHLSFRGPRIVGLALIMFGVLGLIVGVLEYLSMHKSIYPQAKVWEPFRFASVIFALLLGIVEVTLFITLVRSPNF
jgi:putative membrane protein